MDCRMISLEFELIFWNDVIIPTKINNVVIDYGFENFTYV